MSTFASQLLLMALLALCGVWLHHYITSAPRSDEDAGYTAEPDDGIDLDLMHLIGLVHQREDFSEWEQQMKGVDQ